ncbi:MAG: hypothetical protein K8R92_01215 [Planctomycetes bacterium]|nr:hypothetical protein [Planctomycetota bacterium]
MPIVATLSLLYAGCASAQQTAPGEPASAPPNSPTSAPPTNPATSATAPAATNTPPFPVAGLNTLGGRIFNIEPGVAFNSLAPFLLPGDEVRLLPGIHLPFALADLRGDREKPIIIRGYQTEADKPPPYVKGEAYSILLQRPRNVILRDLMVGNSAGPTVVVDGTLGAAPVVEDVPWESNLIVSNLRIRQDGQSTNQSAIYLRSIQKADLSAIKIRGWNSSAFVLDNCRRVGISQCELDTSKMLPQYRGVAIRSGCEDISCMYLSFGPNVQTAFELGVCDPTSLSVPDESLQHPARRILIAHNAVLDTSCFVSLGSVDIANIDSNSIIESSRCVWRADGSCGVPNFVTFENNLVTWVPGRIERISAVAGGIPPESIRLKKNLWWSEELPAAFEIVGKPFGVELAPQVFDINPNVEMHGFNPVEEKARAFGWNNSEKKNPAEAPKTPSAAPKQP